MALLNLFVLLVDYLIELICMYLFIELTFFFSVSVALMSFFPPAWTYQIPFTSLLFTPIFCVDLFLICFHPSLGFCVFAKYCEVSFGHCDSCVLFLQRLWSPRNVTKICRECGLMRVREQSILLFYFFLV